LTIIKENDISRRDVPRKHPKVKVIHRGADKDVEDRHRLGTVAKINGRPDAMGEKEFAAQIV
jgi:hypothetical protein